MGMMKRARDLKDRAANGISNAFNSLTESVGNTVEAVKGAVSGSRGQIELQNFFRAQNEYNKKLRASLVLIMISIITKNKELFNDKIRQVKGNKDWIAISDYFRYNISNKNTTSFASMYQTMFVPQDDVASWGALLGEIKTLEKEALEIRRKKLESIALVDAKAKDCGDYEKAYRDALAMAKGHLGKIPKEISELYKTPEKFAKLLLIYDRNASPKEGLKRELKDKDIKDEKEATPETPFAAQYNEEMAKSEVRSLMFKEAPPYQKVKHGIDDLTIPFLIDLAIKVLTKYEKQPGVLSEHVPQIREYIDLSIRFGQKHILTTFLEKLLNIRKSKKATDASANQEEITKYAKQVTSIKILETFIGYEWVKFLNPDTLKDEYKTVFDNYKSSLPALKQGKIILFSEAEYVLYSLYKDCWVTFVLYKEKTFMSTISGKIFNAIPGLATMGSIGSGIGKVAKGIGGVAGMAGNGMMNIFSTIGEFLRMILALFTGGEAKAAFSTSSEASISLG